MISTGAHSSLSIIVLAAGAGARMKSQLPKPLHTVAGRPMLARVLDVARSLDPIDITVVGSPDLFDHIVEVDWAKGVTRAEQNPPRGTGDAVRIGLEAGVLGTTVLVLYADHPLVTSNTLNDFLQHFQPRKHHIAVMTCVVDDAAGYGRIQRDEHDQVRSIIEKIDDDPQQRLGRTEINSGFMVLDRNWALDALRELPENPRKHEIFLTDLVAVAANESPETAIGVDGDPDVLIGVNDRVELMFADALLRTRKRYELMQAGVTLIVPETNLIDLDIEIGPDSTIGPGCILESGTHIGVGCRIGPNAIIRASSLGDRVRVESSTVEHSIIGSDSDVGPYAHIRDGVEIGQHVHIGNFAELKNARIGDATRIGHFSYIGDATLGEDVNIGAGSITCNFDGIDKHHTEIGPGAFIGSDTMLIAPVSVGAGARTGAGSVVTRDIPDKATVVGMPARQIRRKTQHETATDPEGVQ